MNRVNRATLFRYLESARTAPEILHALAHCEWANLHAGAVCPTEHVPSPKAMVESLMEHPVGRYQEEANELLTDLLGFSARWESQWPTLLFVISRPVPLAAEALAMAEAAGVKVPSAHLPNEVVNGLVPCIWHTEARGGGFETSLEIPLTHVYLLWRRACAAAQSAGKLPPRFSFAPLVVEWQNREAKSDWNSRPQAEPPFRVNAVTLRHKGIDHLRTPGLMAAAALTPVESVVLDGEPFGSAAPVRMMRRACPPPPAERKAIGVIRWSEDPGQYRR